MDLDGVLTEVKRRGGRLTLTGQTFLYQGPHFSLNPELTRVLTANHDAIVAHLKGEDPEAAEKEPSRKFPARMTWEQFTKSDAATHAAVARGETEVYDPVEET
jgi:hypothetical protein